MDSLRLIIFFASIFAVVLAAHLCHAGVLWAEEDLPLATALQVKHGLTLYRDVFFDKPPLVSLTYLLFGVQTGWVLRAAGALYVLLASILTFAIGDSLWGRREGYWAAALIAFFLTFDTPSAVLPLAADLLMLVPHLAAVLLAIRKRPLLSGVAAGIGFLFNAKGVIVLAACALFAWPSILSIVWLAIGFVLPNAVALSWLAATGALPGYIEQVWVWMSLYAGDTFLTNPVLTGVQRTANWLGFHVVLVVGCAAYFWRERNWRMALWILGSYAGVVLGWRFFPRYFFILLPAMTLTAARGFQSLRPRWVVGLALATMLVPMVRFGPKYITLAMGRESRWSDLAMDRDSRAASALLQGMKGTLYVWGYRPEIFVYTGLRPSSMYVECQALTGVPADRHLGQAHVVLSEGTKEARARVIHSKPDIVIDGLGPYNAALAITRYPDMANMLANYREAGRTPGAIIYLRRKE